MPPRDDFRAHGDRRGARTRDPLVALARLFESARHRAGLTSLVLADELGLAIAGAGSATACDELAAHAAVLVRLGAANDTVPTRLDVLGRAMELRRLRIDGIEVLLCAEGPCVAAQPGAETQLSAAVSGCERILGRRRAVACPE